MEYLLLGIVFGALCLLIVACLAQGWVHRDAVYGGYPAYAAITTLASALLGEINLSAHDLSDGLVEILAGMSSRSRRPIPIRFLDPQVTRPMPLEPDSKQDAGEDALDSALPRTN